MLHALYDHMNWADALVWRIAMIAPEDKTLREKLHHIHMVQYAYIDLWNGRTPNPVGPSAFEDLNDLLRWGCEAHKLMGRFLANLGESSPRLDEPLQIPWAERLTERFGKSPAAVTLRESLIQIPQHTTYHRGQVNMRLRQLGLEPPLTDFIAWVWYGKPQPEWP